MTNPRGQRVTPRMLLLGSGLGTLAPTRRLLADAFGVLFTLAVLVGIAVAFDFDRSYAVFYLSCFTAVQVTIVVVRYVRARTR